MAVTQHRFQERFIYLQDSQYQHTYHCIDEQPKRPAVGTLLLLHGFPDLAYGWRYQIPTFVAQGWRVVVPSMLGYGETSKPQRVEEYSFKTVAYDLNALLLELGITGRMTVIGHDWGGMCAWRFANYFPHRVEALVSVCTPYSPPAHPESPFMSTAEIVDKVLPNFGYQLYFESSDSQKEIEAVLPAFLASMLSPRTPGKPVNAKWTSRGALRSWVQQLIDRRDRNGLPTLSMNEELQVYVDTFGRTSMYGPLAWYKTRKVNHEEEISSFLSPTMAPDIPCLLLSPTADAALPPQMSDPRRLAKYFPAGNLEVEQVADAGHFCLQEPHCRQRVTTALADWVKKQRLQRQAHL